MDLLADPLRDSLNPPPRYQLESDSEDEIGEGVYGSTKIIKPSHSKDTTLTFTLSGSIDDQIGRHTIIGVGTAGAQFGRALATSDDSQETPIEANGFKIGTVFRGIASHLFIHISSGLPTTVLCPLSRWLLNTFKPSRLAIVDVYPVPAYINPSPVPYMRAPVRYLETSTPNLPLNPLEPRRINNIEAFSPPNLLGTRTLSSALLPIAQASLMSGRSSLKGEVTLILLPWPRISHPAPNHLDTAALYEGLSLSADSIWGSEELEVAAGAVGMEGMTFVSKEPALQQKRIVSMAEEGMYI